MGDSIYCVNDGEAASKTKMLKNHGILGALNGSTYALLTSTPTVRVGDHLAQEFIPGYGDNNRASAADKYVWNDNNYVYYSNLEKEVKCGDLQGIDIDVYNFFKNDKRCKNKKIVNIEKGLGEINKEDFDDHCGDKENLSIEHQNCFWDYVGYPADKKLVCVTNAWGRENCSMEPVGVWDSVCLNTCFDGNHQAYFQAYLDLAHTEVEPPVEGSECPEYCEVCEDVPGQNFRDLGDSVLAYNGEGRDKGTQGGTMLQLTQQERFEADQCVKKLKDGNSYNNYLNLLKELGVDWQEGDSYCFSNNWNSLTGASEADCTPHFSNADVDYCIQTYCETEAYRKAKENEVRCGRPNVSFFLVQPDKYYASELECQADQEQREEEVELMQEAIDYNT